MSDDRSLYDLMQSIDDQVAKAMRHPNATQADKATLVLGRLNLSEVRRRHMPRWTPLDPATLPAGRVHTFAPVSGLPKGHLLDWEEGQGVVS